MDQDPYSHNDLDTGRAHDGGAMVIGLVATAFCGAAVAAAAIVFAKLLFG